MFRTESFKVCNELRKEQAEKKRREEGQLKNEELDDKTKNNKKIKASKRTIVV